MSLEGILGAIRASTEEQIRELGLRAEEDIRAVREEGEREADRLWEANYREVLRPAAHERSRITHESELKALKIVGEVRNELVDCALERIEEHLATLRNSPQYRDVLDALLVEAFEALSLSIEEDGRGCLRADSRDKENLENSVRKIALDLSVTYDLTTWGGVIVTSADGRIIVNNTLETRLEKALPSLRKHLLKRFYDRGEVNDMDEMMNEPPVFESRVGKDS